MDEPVQTSTTPVPRRIGYRAGSCPTAVAGYVPPRRSQPGKALAPLRERKGRPNEETQGSSPDPRSTQVGIYRNLDSLATLLQRVGLSSTSRGPAHLGFRRALRLSGVPSHVVLFSTDSCAFCLHAKSLLTKRGVVFEEVDLAEHPELQTELAEVTGREGFPQIVVDGEPIGGLNALRAADKSGTLASWSAG